MPHTSWRPAWHVGPWEGLACSPCDVVSTSLTDLIAPSVLGHILVCSSNAPRPLVPGGPFGFAGLSAWSVLSQHSPPPRAAHPSRTRLKCHLLRGAPGASSPLETCCPVLPPPSHSQHQPQMVPFTVRFTVSVFCIWTLIYCQTQEGTGVESDFLLLCPQQPAHGENAVASW